MKYLASTTFLIAFFSSVITALPSPSDLSSNDLAVRKAKAKHCSVNFIFVHDSDGSMTITPHGIYFDVPGGQKGVADEIYRQDLTTAIPCDPPFPDGHLHISAKGTTFEFKGDYNGVSFDAFSTDKGCKVDGKDGEQQVLNCKWLCGPQ